MAKSRISTRCRRLAGAASASAIAIAVLGSAQAGELAFGPVQQVNLKASTITVLGQTFHVGSTAVISSQAKSLSRITLNSISVGTLVSVSGVEAADGNALVQAVTTSSDLNTPGATRLFVAGVVRSVSSVGQVRIGNLTVDVTQTLTSDDAIPAVGSFVDLAGTQPVSNGLFLASSLIRSQGIGGTGASAGIGGTGASLGIGGTGASAGIGGTGASLGIGGTGASAGIGGTGASLGIGGTGASAGIGGTGASLGIGGTGASAGIGGTGASLGIGGTGASAGIGGTGASLGIGGTGAKKSTGASLGIGGTGASAGIGGTG